jgi:undecaprenyl phosphate N,N'-diacetylbacillosamine 1-phosphate transferase
MLYKIIFKRCIDLTVATIAFALLSPVFLVLTVILFVVNDGKPFFLQPRPGRKGRVFKVIKFKTMNDRRSADGDLLPDAVRLTPAGSFVRKTSLDEVPQLLNVIKGDMSLVGPRPLLVEYLERYNERQLRRHDVKPGITGWAQVNGRNAIGWEQKFEYDVWYVEQQSFALDAKIIWRTFAKVFRSEGISQQGQATMEKFMGS